MGRIVAKFGGSSLADAGQFRKVRDILRMDARRVFVVPSAPGRRFAGDEKVTDLLYRCYRLRNQGEDFSPVFGQVARRYQEIAAELALTVPIAERLAGIEKDIAAGASEDYCASRGEYLNGLLLSDFLGLPFVDAAEVVCFNDDGSFDSERTNTVMGERLSGMAGAVVPGFYGGMPDGRVHTFTRGGSDISGAIVARAVMAETYENWTDVSGFLMADPRVVRGALPIETITYQELRELSYMGATVLHEDSVFPVHRAGIPTNIRNTNCPEAPGTIICHDSEHRSRSTTITGVAGRKGFSVISVEKAMMNSERGFGRKVLQAIEEQGISFEHLPTGIDTLCVVVAQEALDPYREQVVSRIVEMTNPDSVTIHDDMAIIATVGRGMIQNCGTAARLFMALSRSRVNVRMIDQGSSEISILVGVEGSDFEKAIRAIYDEFVGRTANT